MHEPGHWKSRVRAFAFHKLTHQWLQVMIWDGFCLFVTGGVSLGGIPHRGSMGTILQRKDRAIVPDLRDRDATPRKAEGPPGRRRPSLHPQCGPVTGTVSFRCQPDQTAASR